MFNNLLKHDLYKYKNILIIFTPLIVIFSSLFILLLHIESESNLFFGIIFGVILLIILVICGISLIINTIRNYLSDFYTADKYLTYTLPISMTKIFLSKFLSFVISGYILVNLCIISLRLTTFIIYSIQDYHFFFFFKYYFDEQNIGNTLSLISLGIGATFYLINFLLCFNISKLPKFASKSILTIIISLIITIALYESIISLIELSIMNLTISYLISIILTISLIGLEIIFIIKTLKKI